MVEDGDGLISMRVLVPRVRALQRLHKAHQGASGMPAKARQAGRQQKLALVVL